VHKSAYVYDRYYVQINIPAHGEIFYRDDKRTAPQRDGRNASQRPVVVVRRHDEHCLGERSQTLPTSSL